MKMYELFLTCPKGLEKVCKKELQKITSEKISISSGGISLSGNILDIYKINIHSRIGMNLLVKLSDFNFKNIDELYKAIYQYKWHTVIDPKLSFSIDTNIIAENRNLNNSQFASLKIKDAICDKILKTRRKRPFVDKNNPDIYIRAVISGQNCKIYLNSSGNPLYIRGYKNNVHKASIYESLASGLIALSGWNKNDNFLDPMCGSGTIPLEASMIKKEIPAGIYRDFSFQKWMNYDKDIFSSIIKNAKQRIDEESKSNIYASDINSDYVNSCNLNLQDFKFNLGLNFRLKNINSFDDCKKYHIVTNPPYEIRIGDEYQINIIHKGFQKLLKSNCSIYIIYPENSDFIKDNYNCKKISTLYNGPIKCGFYEISI